MDDIRQLLANAMSHHQAGRLREAEELYRRILAHDPKQADALHLLGMIAFATGQHELAVTLIGRAIQAWRDKAVFYSNLGRPLLALGRIEQAQEAFQTAINLAPNWSPPYDGLSAAHLALGRTSDAIAAAKRAIELDGNNATAHFNFGTSLRSAGEIAEAIVAFQRVVQLTPLDADAWESLGTTYLDQGEVEQALRAYERAIALDPNQPHRFDARLLAMHYDARSSPQDIFQAHLQFGERFDPVVAKPALERNAKERLRVGYISPDLRAHAVASFLEPILRSHDRTQFEIFAYSHVTRPDAVTRRLQSFIEHWRDISSLNDQAVIGVIGADDLDILVDLAGHTAGNRLPIFTARPARIAVTYLGYPNTTGLRSIDFRFTDELADPTQSVEAIYAERLWRLPHGFLCYGPPADAPAINPLPATGREGRITFVSFNNIAKVGLPAMQTWARILEAMPGSTLLVKLGRATDKASLARVHARFESAGVPSGQMTILPSADSFAAHLATYHLGDIALDTFPYNGTTTTCEALWMGLPVITMAGRSHVSRVGVSILTHAGFPEWIAKDSHEYVEKAVRMASDLPRLAALRANMHEALEQASLLNARQFTAELEEAYRGMFQGEMSSRG